MIDAAPMAALIAAALDALCIPVTLCRAQHCLPLGIALNISQTAALLWRYAGPENIPQHLGWYVEQALYPVDPAPEARRQGSPVQINNPSGVDRP